jgi:two-component system, chemotaxis family, sensor kinase CheA
MNDLQTNRQDGLLDNLLDEVRDEGEIPQKYLSIFVDESEASLDLLTSTLLALERGGKDEDLKRLMGTAHKIKGSAAAIGLNRIAKLTHLIEDVLQELLQTHGSLPTGVTDVLLKCTDSLQRNVAELKQGADRSDHFSQLASELLAARASSHCQEPRVACGQATEPAREHAAAPASPPPAAPTVKAKPVQDDEQRAAGAGQRPTETVRVDIDRLDHLMDLASQLVISKAQFSQLGDKLRNTLGYNCSAQALNKVSTELDRIDGQIALRLDGKHPAAALDGIRTHVRRIQNELQPLRREVEALRRTRIFVEELFEAIHQLGRVSDGIQQSVMDTRMVPIGPLFARFKRTVRDITHATSKQARLEIRGENTELDKRMIDELGDPLVHLVRNAVDHGIESPENREAAGKPREGTVTLNAFHRGSSIVIEVQDDGQGLDADRILRKCLENGLVSRADADKMTTQQVFQKIWEPGLSTADQVTEVSGRGMGMDIVKSKIEELSGTVDIQSVPGQGTTITIKLPLTLAILPSLMVEIRGDVFAIPMEAVVEIVGIAQDQVSSAQGRQLATVRGRVVSLLYLADLLSFHGGNGEASRLGDTTLVLVTAAGVEFGLAVDRVVGEADVVIQSIAENFTNVAGIAGASILGDGRVSLILDIAGLVEILSRKAACLTC